MNIMISLSCLVVGLTSLTFPINLVFAINEWVFLSQGILRKNLKFAYVNIFHNLYK